MAKPPIKTKPKTGSKPTRRTRATRKPSATVATKRMKQSAAPVAAEEVAQPAVTRRWWRRTPKSERPVQTKLPSVIQLVRQSYELLLSNWKLIVGISLIYGLLNMILVRGLSGGVNTGELRAQFDALQGGSASTIASSLGVAAQLITSSNTTTASESSNVYQTILLLITSLALVWSFRQLRSPKAGSIRVRDAFYKGMYPLIPVLLVLLVISLQFIPLLIGTLLFNLISSNGIATTILEAVITLVVFLGLALWSLLLVTPSVIALYIASLPDMTPLKALRSARSLVRFRRLVVLRKLLFLPVFILVLLGVILLPIIFAVPVAAQWIYLVLSMFILPVVHAYVYTLYRGLLDD